MRHGEQAEDGPEGDQKTAAGGMSHDAQYVSESFHTISCSAGFVPEEGGRSRFVDNAEIRMLKCPHVDWKDVTK